MLSASRALQEDEEERGITTMCTRYLIRNEASHDYGKAMEYITNSRLASILNRHMPTMVPSKISSLHNHIQ